MDDFNKQNEYGLSGEFADIYASVFGNAPVEQPAKDNPKKFRRNRRSPVRSIFPKNSVSPLKTNTPLMIFQGQIPMLRKKIS